HLLRRICSQTNSRIEMRRKKIPILFCNAGSPFRRSFHPLIEKAPYLPGPMPDVQLEQRRRQRSQKFPPNLILVFPAAYTWNESQEYAVQKSSLSIAHSDNPENSFPIYIAS